MLITASDNPSPYPMPPRRRPPFVVLLMLHSRIGTQTLPCIADNLTRSIDETIDSG
jgi:hypothetical protein